MSWWTDKQAQTIAVEAKRRLGKGWSWMNKAMREGVVAREVGIFLRAEAQDDAAKVGDVVELMEASFKAAGLRLTAKKNTSPYVDGSNRRNTFRAGE